MPTRGLNFGFMGLVGMLLPVALYAGLDATVDPNDKKEEPKETQVLDREWREYLRFFGGTTPFEAINNARIKRFQIRKDHVQNVLKGNTKIDLHATFYYRDKAVEKVDLSSFSHALRLEAHDQMDLQIIDPGLDKDSLLSQTSRFRNMREAMQQLVFNRDPDELVLIFAGQTHTLDLFFSSFLIPDKRDDEPYRRLEEEVYYVALPLDGSTPFYTPEYLQFVRAMRGTQETAMNLKSNDLNIYTNFLARLAYYNGLKVGLIKEEELYQRPLKRLGALAVMDLHDARLPQIFDRLPSPESLKVAGFNQVTLGLEGVKYGEFYHVDSLREFYTASLDRYLKDDEEKDYYRRFRKKAYALLEKGFVSRPMMHALDRKLRKYRSAGIEVRITGLESQNRLGFKKVVAPAEPKLVDVGDQP